RRASRHAGGIEGVHGRAVPRVDAGHAEGELVEVRTADDARARCPCSGQAGCVARRRTGTPGYGPATGRRRLAFHVDQVLDPEAHPGTGCLVPSDEGGHVERILTDPGGASPVDSPFVSWRPPSARLVSAEGSTPWTRKALPCYDERGLPTTGATKWVSRHASR